eukprot:Protomagalhaensia_wolfi_Nauph_80__738@NODE_1420_length_1539_cov_15_792667_g1098_i0_p3_GENE_NODE_1420_length_1539_cov_15_792667_g1098_i0NODE_1420_length_1539_cov_15_792667_g1098_i0_p3_ORF_typecomplete_len113_score10_07Ferlin_C/PF16165_5/1_4e05_NODE_1420_length_1539_cov_15_792667_g1098_i010991437
MEPPLNQHLFTLHSITRASTECRNHEDDEVRGFIQCTVQLIPQTEAVGRPVGLGRNEPNRDPNLIVPLAGRSWSDFLHSGSSSTNFAGWWHTVNLFSFEKFILLRRCGLYSV